MVKVFVLLKNGFEEIEALTVVDYLRRAQIDVYTVSTVEGLEVTGSHKIIVKADMMFEDLDREEVDLLFVPGGMPAAKDLSLDQRVLDLVFYLDKEGKAISAICAGPIVLEAAGILKGKKATSYPGFEDQLQSLDSYQEDLVVVDDNVVTSRGPASAVYLALELIELLKGREKKEEIKSSIVQDLVENAIKNSSL